jgi:hypothetical protein
LSNVLFHVALIGIAAVAYWVWKRHTLHSRRVPDGNAWPAAGSGELGRRLLQGGELSQVLQNIVEGVRATLGAERVLLRLYNSRTRLFEPRAFAGCDDQLIHELSNADVSLDQVTSLMDTVGSQFVLGGDALERSVFPDRQLRRARSWGILLCDLPAAGSGPQGYLAVEVPPGAPADWATSQEQTLSCMAAMASLAISSARLHGRLEQKGVELSLASEKLKDVQKLKDNFVGVVSHELRTPLTSIKAYAEMMSRAMESAKPETVSEFTKVILHESDRLEQAFNDILKVSELENSRAHLITDEMDLMVMLREVLDEQRDEFRQAELSIALEAPTEVMPVRADRAGLREVLFHLLENARKFTEPGGRVILRLRHGVSAVRIEVEDDGVGIPEDELRRVFERFHQVDNGSTRRFGGQGLGLTICRDIVRRHGGQIWAEAGQEKGARIVVLLPSKGVVIQPMQLKSLDASEKIHREEFLHLLISFVAETMQVHTTSLMLVDKADERLYVEAAVGLADDIVRSVRLRKGEAIAGHVWETNRSLLIGDITRDPRFTGRLNHAQYKRNSLLSVPILRGGDCIGVLNVNNKNSGEDCGEEDLLLLEAIAARAEHALRDFDVFRVGHRRLVADNAALSAIIDLGRGRGSRLRHRLGGMGFDTGRRLGLDAAGLRQLSLGLRIYDLGLSVVDAEILRKVTPLTPGERRSVDDHVHAGAELAQGIELPPGILKILVHHHENSDGTGYPDGLSGEAIPLGARIVRLVDFAHGALTDRPGRLAWDLDSLEELVERESGKVFCPRVTPIFLGLLREGRAEVELLLKQPSETQRVCEEPEFAYVPQGVA